MTRAKRIDYLKSMYEENFAKLFENEFLDEIYINVFEADNTRMIVTDMNYNTKHGYNINFTETNDLSTLSFKTKSAYNYFKKQIVELFEI